MAQYYLGIDVGKYEHQAVLIDEEQRPVGQSVRFQNNIESFRAWLNQVKESVPETAELMAGMESTGHYWINLNNFLQENGVAHI